MTKLKRTQWIEEKLSILNQIRNGTKLSIVPPHSQHSTSDLRKLRQKIEMKELKVGKDDTKFSYLQMI